MLELPDRYSRAGPFNGLADSEQPGPSARRRDFTSFGHTVRGSNRVLAFRSRLHVASGGRLLLRDFLAAISRVCHGQEIRSVVTALVGAIEAAGWERVSGPGVEAAFQSSGFQLSVRVVPLPAGVAAVHVFLEHGNTERFLAHYLGVQFPWHAGRLVPSAEGGSPSDRPRLRPQTPRVMDTPELAGWLRRGPCIALTGAGMSLASGIPPFTGPGSLETYFPLEERFPGSVFDWAVHRPTELASVVGSFQAALLTARPNRAHLALAELERRGVVQQVLTTNFDDLHQAAGSLQVHKLEHGNGREAGACAGGLLVIGVAHDDFGVVSAARAAGRGVVVLNPELPEFVQESDLFLRGRAEDVLPEVKAVLFREGMPHPEC